MTFVNVLKGAHTKAETPSARRESNECSRRKLVEVVVCRDIYEPKRRRHSGAEPWSRLEEMLFVAKIAGRTCRFVRRYPR